MNNFPREKLNEQDEGQLEIGILVENNTVIINFFKPVSWIGLDTKTAIALAETIIDHVNKIRTIQ